MKTLAVLCNVVLFTFTCFVLATDGAPAKAVYIIFTLLLLMTPAFTVFVLARRTAGDGARWAAAICNVLLLAFVCWALVDQYPHPSDPGFNEYVVAVVVTPLISAVVLLRGRLARRPSAA
ncbi:MAG: hypothetical protein H6Q10_760 [Acidobacteria bacterium]|nr:hypothetical protein [Acidobacteriota bacterium]